MEKKLYFKFRDRETLSCKVLISEIGAIKLNFTMSEIIMKNGYIFYTPEHEAVRKLFKALDE